MANYTYEATASNTLIPEGDYEVSIERIQKRKTPNGKEKLSLMFRIREDVEQIGKNRVLFEDIWAEKDNPGVYNRKRINQLLGTQKDVVDGQVFETIDDIIEFIEGAQLIVHINIELDTYRGEDVNNVAYYKSSKTTPRTVATTSPAATEVISAVTGSDDLPF